MASMRFRTTKVLRSTKEMKYGIASHEPQLLWTPVEVQPCSSSTIVSSIRACQPSAVRT